MHVFRIFVSIASLGLVAAALACSGGGGGSTGGGTLTTSAPPNKEVAQLTSAEGKQYCTELGNYVNAELAPLTRKSQCLSEARRALGEFTSDAELRSKCSSAYQECLAKPEASKDSLDPSKCESSSSACTATVAEVNRCFEDYVAAARAAGAVLDSFCNRIQMDGGGIDRSGLSSEPPASCKAIASKCPGIAGGD